MTYFGVLFRFVIFPLIVLRILLRRDRKQNAGMPPTLSSWDENVVLAGHAITAVTYTTLWDNYLVAKKVWGYDPKLVTGLKIGWVPIEEYSFFVLQTLLTGSWMQVLAHRIDEPIDMPYGKNKTPQLMFTGALGMVWLWAARSLYQKPNNYLGLILIWALPPIMLQTAFGGDILWRHRKLVASSIISSTAYLSWVDSLAIGQGTWKINQKNTVKHEVIPNLPFEEFLFFLLTNVLLVFGVTLVQAKESEHRLPKLLQSGYFGVKSRLKEVNQ